MYHNLSWIYFREQLPDGTWWNICFEELSKDKQDEILAHNSEEWKNNMILLLCKTINEIWEQFNIYKE